MLDHSDSPISRGRRYAWLLALTLVGLTARTSAAADSPSAAQDAALSARVRTAMQPFLDKNEVSGVVTLVGSGDGVLSLDTVGRRDIEKDAPMQPDTVFRIASMTKPITAIGIMMLVDEGTLAVDDPVEKHLPEFRGQMLVATQSPEAITLNKPSRPITIRDLLTHTSGMPGSPPAGLADLYARRNHTLAEAVMAYSQRPLTFEPGSKWAYCNVGIDTLGRLIEVASGQSYESFLKQRLFDPLGMSDTTFYPTPEQLARTAATYNRKDGILVAVANSIIGPPTGATYPIPAGGLYATAGDLAKVYRMMLGGGVLDGKRYLSEASVKTMTQVQTGDLKTGFSDGMGFGFGWGVVRQPSGVTEALSPGSFGHGGAYGTQAWIDPTKGRFAILMIQRVGLANSDASEIRRALQGVAFETAPPSGPAPDPEKAIAEIQKLGGKIERDDKQPDKPVILVNLGITDVNDAALENLKAFTRLKKLTLNDTPITDAGLDHIKGLASLEKLYLVDTKITDAGLERLKGLTHLQVLSLAGTQVGDPVVETLKGLSSLKELFLYGTKVGDDAAKKLQEALPNAKLYR